jgi:hypothetical protein
VTREETDVLLTAGKYAAAVTAITAMLVLSVKLFVTPMIAEERIARQKMDDRIAMHLVLMTRDRLDMLDIVMTAPGQDRERKLTIVRQKWAQEEELLRQEGQ